MGGACMAGGHVWPVGHAWLWGVTGGVHGWGACMAGGAVWLGVCMVGGYIAVVVCMAGVCAWLGGMHGSGVCGWGCVWLGVCVAGGCALHGGCIAGVVCMAGGMRGGGVGPGQTLRLWHTVNEWAVRILLECIHVSYSCSPRLVADSSFLG